MFDINAPNKGRLVFRYNEVYTVRNNNSNGVYRQTFFEKCSV